jgi:hypothetical protein
LHSLFLPFAVFAFAVFTFAVFTVRCFCIRCFYFSLFLHSLFLLFAVFAFAVFTVRCFCIRYFCIRCFFFSRFSGVTNVTFNDHSSSMWLHNLTVETYLRASMQVYNCFLVGNKERETRWYIYNIII